MITKTKGRTDCHQATLDTAQCTTNCSGVPAGIEVGGMQHG